MAAQVRTSRLSVIQIPRFLSPGRRPGSASGKFQTRTPDHPEAVHPDLPADQGIVRRVQPEGDLGARPRRPLRVAAVRPVGRDLEVLDEDVLSPLFKEAIGQLGDMTYTRTLVSYEGLNGQYDATSSEGVISLVSAERSNTRFIACVMGAADADAAHNDIVKLLDYGYANYKSVTMTKDSVGTKEVELQDGEESKQFTFYLASDLFALMPSSADESLLKTEVVLVDENDPDRIQAYVAIHMGEEEIGRITMQKKVTVLNPKTPMEMLYTYFSYGCMAVAALGILLFVFKHASRAVKPSE